MDLPTSQALKSYRERRGLSKQALADELGVSRQTYHAWEVGKIPTQGPAQALIRLLVRLQPFIGETNGKA